MSNSPAERHRIAGEAEPLATPLADPAEYPDMALITFGEICGFADTIRAKMLPK